MLSTLALSLALVAPAQTLHPITKRPLPEDWPPLPDFKTRVDYVQWYQAHMNQGVTDDAWPLWDKLRQKKDDPEEVKQANDRMWGWNEKGRMAGLFSGDDPAPDRYTWRPGDHPDWEKAYQAQKAHGLHAKLIEASNREHLSWSVQVPTVAEPPFTSLDGKKQLDRGLTGTERLILNLRTPLLSVHRAAVRVLLESAWRAENGRVDQDAMFDAITASLRIARQVEGNRRGLIHILVGFASHPRPG